MLCEIYFATYLFMEQFQNWNPKSELNHSRFWIQEKIGHALQYVNNTLYEFWEQEEFPILRGCFLLA